MRRPPCCPASLGQDQARQGSLGCRSEAVLEACLDQCRDLAAYLVRPVVGLSQGERKGFAGYLRKGMTLPCPF